jgi:arginase
VQAACAPAARRPPPAWTASIHLDVDVLDEAAMPATDYLMPGGLEWDELAALLAPLAAAPGLAGFSLGCLNPEKDPGGRWTDRTCELLAGAFGAA